MFELAAKSLQSCPTLCDPIDGRPPGSPVSGIFQARTLEWVAISFSNAWKWKVKVKLLSHVQLLATSWTAAHQAPPSMGFSRQEYWSGVPLPSPVWAYSSINRNNTVSKWITVGIHGCQKERVFTYRQKFYNELCGCNQRIRGKVVTPTLKGPCGEDNN